MLDRTKFSPEALAVVDANPAAVLGYAEEFVNAQAELQEEGFTLESYVALRLRDDHLLKVEPQALHDATNPKRPEHPNPLVDSRQRFGVGSDDI